MRLGEYILLFFSKESKTCDYSNVQQEWTLKNAFFLLCKNFPDFTRMIVNKRVLDFGCGTGYQSAALAIAGADFVLGVDTNLHHLKIAKDLVDNLNLQNKVQFASNVNNDMRNQFDIIISQNSMEHFFDPITILNEMKYALKQGGKILITFGPPWYAPYGSHMQFFTRLPWVNILFSERTVMNVRSYFRNDGALKYEEVESGLNKMTIAKFERILSKCELLIIYRKYRCVKNLNFLGKMPVLRELFINQIDCILEYN